MSCEGPSYCNDSSNPLIPPQPRSVLLLALPLDQAELYDVEPPTAPMGVTLWLLLLLLLLLVLLLLLLLSVK